LQAALLHLDTKRYYSLNESGCLIWQLLARGLDVAAIATELQREYEITDGACREQVAAFLAVLEAEGLAAP